MQDTDDFLGFGDDEIAIAASAVANRRKEIAERFRDDLDFADYAENVEVDVATAPATDPAPKKKKNSERKATKKLPIEEPKPKEKERQPPAKTKAKAPAEPVEPTATPPTASEVRSTPRRRELERKKKEAAEQAPASDPERASEAAHSILSEKLQEILAAKKKKKNNATRASSDEDPAQEQEIVPKKKAKKSKEGPSQPASQENVPKKKAKRLREEPAQPSSGSKQLIRPSKLGGFGAKSESSKLSPGGSAPNSSSSTPAPATTPTRLFGSSPSELIVEGKRAWKPSAKVQDQMDAESPAVKQFITQYADAMAGKKDKGGGGKAKQPQDEGMQKIERILKGETLQTTFRFKYFARLLMTCTVKKFNWYEWTFWAELFLPPKGVPVPGRLDVEQ